MERIQLTVFTAVYNRLPLIKRLYESLKKQTSYEFEWLVIDDESNDNTYEYLKKLERNESSFSIRVIKQKHGGKHRALNKAFDLARGDYIFPVDSDDYLLPKSIETVIGWLEQINDNTNIIGVSGLRIFPNGQVIGNEMGVPKNSFIETSIFSKRKYNLQGDKAEIFRTELCRQHKFPEFDNEYFVTEGVCWNAISNDGGMIRWYNTPIYVCQYLPDGLTCTGANLLRGHIDNFKGYAYYIKQSIYNDKFDKYELSGLLWGYIKTNISMGIYNPLKQARNIDCSINKYLFLILRIPYEWIKNKICCI